MGECYEFAMNKVVAFQNKSISTRGGYIYIKNSITHKRRERKLYLRMSAYLKKGSKHLCNYP